MQTTPATILSCNNIQQQKTPKVLLRSTKYKNGQRQSRGNRNTVHSKSKSCHVQFLKNYVQNRVTRGLHGIAK